MNHHQTYLPARSIRTRDWKYIHNFADSSYGLDQCCPFEWAHELVELPDQPWKAPRVEEELFQLSADPNEQVNLAYEPEYAEVLAEMRALLRDRMSSTADPFLDSPFERVYLDTHCGTRNDGPGPSSPIPLTGCFWIWGEPICPPLSCQ
jgi:arylsulfatase A-like enzyme